MFLVQRQYKQVHTFLFPLWFSKLLLDSCVLVSAGGRSGEQQCGCNIFKYNIQWNINSSKEANISHHCSWGRKRIVLPLPQALSVFLINSQSFPLFPSHPDPQLSPLVLWTDSFLRHPATLLLAQPARGDIKFQLSDKSSSFEQHWLLVGLLPAMVCSSLWPGQIQVSPGQISFPHQLV